MYSISLMLENISNDSGGEVVSNVMVIRDLKTITPENLKPVVEILSHLACESQFIRKGTQ
jgi:hypothetical protein